MPHRRNASEELMLKLITSYISCEIGRNEVARQGFVSYDGAKYGVPWQYSGKEVRVCILDGNFEVYNGEVRIACHKVE